MPLTVLCRPVRIGRDPQAVFDRESAGPTHPGRYAGLAADAWLSTGRHAAAACVYLLLTTAGKADAWDDKMPTINSVYMQNWLLRGTALAYLKVRNSGEGTAQRQSQCQGILPREMGYWSIVGPVWDAIDIYSGPDVFRQTFSSVPRASALLFAAALLSVRDLQWGFQPVLLELYWRFGS